MNYVRWKPNGFPFTDDHDEFLIEQWNSVVGQHDTVYILGDAVWNKRGLERVRELNGMKRLVMGNHDQLSSRTLLDVFMKLYGALHMEVDGLQCIFTHIPIARESLRPRFDINIHGHMHTRSIRDPGYICVSAEHLALRPTPLEEIVAQWKQNNTQLT